MQEELKRVTVSEGGQKKEAQLEKKETQIERKTGEEGTVPEREYRAVIQVFLLFIIFQINIYEDDFEMYVSLTCCAILFVCFVSQLIVFVE